MLTETRKLRTWSNKVLTEKNKSADMNQHKTVREQETPDINNEVLTENNKSVDMKQHSSGREQETPDIKNTVLTETN